MAASAGTATTTETAPPTASHPPPKTTISPPTDLRLTVEFTGGLEILFDNVSKHRVTLPATVPPTAGKTLSSSSAAAKPREDAAVPATAAKPTTVGYLIAWLLENLLRDPRKELFVVDGAVRPGILVLINDADWELEGEDKYELNDGDNILFVSTLHGG